MTDLEKKIETLKDMLKIQCTDGTWNHDHYMHGMTNGMIFALSILEDKDPKYLQAPKVWLKDITTNKLPEFASEV